MLTEERKRSMDLEMGLEGNEEETNAAKLIQSKFRDLQIRRTSKPNIHVNGSTDSGEFHNNFTDSTDVFVKDQLL